MKILGDLIQGSAAWHVARARHNCASDAPTMMGASKFKSRSDLVRQKALGLIEDVDAGTQQRFDAGHAAEAAIRPYIAAKLGGDLLPVVATDNIGWLLASYDGLYLRTGWEHKLWNEELAAMVRAKNLSPMYFWQLEHHILVGDLERVIFTVSDGTPDRCLHMVYKAVPGRAVQLVAGWHQFDADVAAYQHVEHIPAAVATPTMALPALSIQVKGSLTLIDNLSLFGEKLKAFIIGINKEPKDDQAFADLEAAVKTLQTAQDALEAAEASALAQTASIDEMRRTVAMYKELARSNRLMFDKLVKAKKETIRADIVGEGVMALRQHVDALNARIGRPFMRQVSADFPGAVKGKKTIASLRDGVATELARAKIIANEFADRIDVNLKLLAANAEHQFLFADAATICLKMPDDFAALVKSRIHDHQDAERKKEEAQRERIRIEEERKAREKVDAEAVEAKRRADAAEMAKFAAAAQLAQQPAANEQPKMRATTASPYRAQVSYEPQQRPTTRQRPSDEQLLYIAAKGIAEEFDVTFDVASQWLREIHWQAAA